MFEVIATYAILYLALGAMAVFVGFVFWCFTLGRKSCLI